MAAACGGGSGSDGRTGAPERRAGEVRIAAGEDIWPLTGTGPSSKAFAAGELSVGVYEPLVSLAPDFTVRPGLAERWEQVAGGAWRFHLRPGVTFHDGRPLTSEDVVWSWTQRQFYPTSVTSSLGPGSVVAIDPRTVEFRPVEVDNRLPEKLVHPEGAILPKGGHSDAEPPVGTGPYRVVEYVPRRHVVVERYDGYWGPAPAVARLVFVFHPDPQARVAALRSGEVDVAANLTPAAARTVSGPGLRVVEAPPGAVHHLSFNVGGARASELAAEPALRRAVALALDRPAYVAEVLAGAGVPGRWPAPAAVLGPAADAVPPPRHDPAAAAALLDEAGWAPGPDGVRRKGGRRLTLTVVGGPSAPEAGLAWVRDRLAAVGIEVATKKAFDVVTLNDFRVAGYDAELGMSNQNDADPGFLVGLRAAGDAGAGRPQLAAAAAGVRAAPDRPAAQRAAAEAMRVMVELEVLTVPLAAVSRAAALAQGIELREVHPSAINQSWASLVAAR